MGEGVMRRAKYHISSCVCNECETIMPIPRRIGEEREKGHIKDMYCPKCNKISKFLEIRNMDNYKNFNGEHIDDSLVADCKIRKFLILTENDKMSSRIEQNIKKINIPNEYVVHIATITSEKAIRQLIEENKYDAIINGCNCGRNGDLMFADAMDLFNLGNLQTFRLKIVDDSDSGIKTGLYVLFCKMI